MTDNHNDPTITSIDLQQEPQEPTGPTDPNPTKPIPGEPDPYPVVDPPVEEPPPAPAPPEPIPQFPPDVTYRVAPLKKVKDGEKGHGRDDQPKYQPLQKSRVPEFFNRLM